MSEQIDVMLAVALAGQVSVGLTPGEGQCERALGALTAIGIMLRNASDSELVQGALDLIGTTVVTEYGDGVTRIESRRAQ